MSSARDRRQQDAAENRRAWFDPIFDPMDALMSDQPDDTDDETEEETEEELDVWEESRNSSLRELSRLSRFITIKLVVVCILIATSFGRDFLADNSPYISDMMGWSTPQCEFQVPATSRLRVAKFNANEVIHSASINGSYDVQLSNPNTSSIYPVREVEQPNVLSDEFKVLVCAAGTEFNSTGLNASELPPLINFPLDKNTSPDTPNASVASPQRESDRSASTRPGERRGGFMMVAAESVPPARNASEAQKPKSRNRHKFDPNTHPAVLLARRYGRPNATRPAQGHGR